MDTSWMERTRLLVGAQGLEKLNKAHVLIVGLGGVGSYAAEAIGRSGVGKMTIIDGDTVDPTGTVSCRRSRARMAKIRRT